MFEDAFAKLETSYPEERYLSVSAYQIAQSYFYHLIFTRNEKYVAPSKKWMNKTIEFAKGKDTFYSYIAQASLGKNCKV